MKEGTSTSSRAIGAALAGIVLLGVAIWWHAAVLAPFVLSLALAYVLEPLVAKLVGHGWPRVWAVAVCVVMAVLVLLVLFLLLVPIALDLGPHIQQLPILASDAWHSLVPYLRQVGIRVPEEFTDLRPVLVKLFQTHGNQWGNAILQSALVGGNWLLTLGGLAILVPMLVFYWLLDWPSLMQGWRNLLPHRWRANVDSVIHEADDVMGHYLRGQLTVMMILAVYYSVGLWLFGFNLAWPIGVFTGLAVFIPYVGFGLGLLMALLTGFLQFSAQGEPWWWPLMAVGLVYGVGQVVESMYLTPRLVGERIGLHPIGVIFVLMLFAQWMGFVGVLVALPVSALCMVLLRRLVACYQQSAFYGGPPKD